MRFSSKNEKFRENLPFSANLFGSQASILPNLPEEPVFPLERGHEPPTGLTPVAIGGTLTVEGEVSLVWPDALP